MLKVHSLIYLSLTWLLLLASCDPHIAYEENTRLHDYEWDRDSVPQFAVHISDASRPYAISVNIRHNNFYPYSNLVFSLREQHAPNIDTAYREELTLAKSDGRWIGQSAGNLFQVNHLILETYTFPDTGVYHFSLQHHMEDHQLKGMTDLGLKIVQKP